ncbi:MAG TPA: hypothetical protein VEV16_07260 [Daejeonella sp.]|nr:hypothetical protein [Daejeonella sp.]
MKMISLLGVLLIHSLILLGQGERGISKMKVPPKISSYIHLHFPNASNIRYYREVNKDTLFIESRFTSQHDKYTLKFQNDTLFKEGVQVLFKEIPAQVQSAIQSKLQSLFSRYYILESHEVNPQSDPFYEIRVKGRAGKSGSFYEIYFDKLGNFVSKREILLEPIPTEP